mgnify:CR=1 FL=1
MYLERKEDKMLIEWKMTDGHKPLIIKGARQVGKTETIRNFAKNNYESLIEINFVEEPKYRTITADGYRTVDIIKNISLLDPSKRFIPGKTLIFFDEIQQFPDIATSLKFFVQDERFDVICSGSLLGISYKSIESNSVGYKTDHIMRSLDFEEFMWSKGYTDTHINMLYEKMKTMTPLNEAELAVWHKAFLEYSVLGGMPEVIRNYTQPGTFEGSLETQRQLVEDYKEDIRKYTDGMDQARIMNVFNSVAPQLAKENKKFQISKVASGARFKDYRGCIEWLLDSGIVNVCYCLHFPELPLKGNFDADKYKLYFADTGLLVSMLDDEAQEDLRANKNLGVYKGALYENIVAEALVKDGYELYYYKKDDSTLEEDFFVRSKDKLIPVEVKAANNRSKSLRTLINSERYPDITCGLKFTGGNIGYSDDIYSFPYFCCFLLRRFLAENSV